MEEGGGADAAAALSCEMCQGELNGGDSRIQLAYFTQHMDRNVLSTLHGLAVHGLGLPAMA